MSQNMLLDNSINISNSANNPSKLWLNATLSIHAPVLAGNTCIVKLIRFYFSEFKTNSIGCRISIGICVPVSEIKMSAN